VTACKWTSITPRPPSPRSLWLAAHASGIEAAPLPPADPLRVPSLSIVVMVVGSRGDVQPFIPIARRLARRHRVRVATHREFRPMIEQAGLEFYPLGGNPHQLMEYIVRTGGSILPTRVDQLWDDVPKKRAMIAEIHTLNSVQQLHAVKARVIDVAFMWRSSADDNLRIDGLLAHPLAVALSVRHRLAARTYLSPRDLQGESYVTLDPNVAPVYRTR